MVNYEQKLRKYSQERENYGRVATKNKLKVSVRKKMDTMMIGILARFEQYFGKTWGHGKVDKECTDEQFDKKAIWKMCRQDVLDFGNSLIRSVDKDLNKYDVEAEKTQEKIYNPYLKNGES